MRVFAFLPLLLLGCADYDALCAANDPSVDAATCWKKGWNAGYNSGASDAYDAEFEEGYAACEEDYDGW